MHSTQTSKFVKSMDSKIPFDTSRSTLFLEM